MNKTKILAFIALAAIFSACGPDEGGGSQPSLKNTEIGFISPFDILEVEFDSKIVSVNDWKPSTKMELLNDSALKQLGIKKSDNILYFRGKDSVTLGGLPYFASGISAFITFKEVENSDGYKRDSTIFRFSTYPILDDLSGNNDTLKRAVDLGTFFLNSKTVSFAGVIDHKIGASKVNFEDYYKITMQMRDNLIILAKSRDSLIVNITEPIGNISKSCYASPKKEIKCELTVGSEHLTDPNEPWTTPVDFYISISDDGSSSAPPNPYTLTVSRLR